MAESYGLSKSEYRKLIDDPTVSAKMLSQKIVKPDCVYRYRRLGHEDNGTWVENTFWKDDVNGICLFSVPDSFNKNDDNDCKVRFDNDAVFRYMFPASDKPSYEEAKTIIDNVLNEYKASLQTKMKVGCFTAVNPLSLEMWNDSNFGDDGRGMCFEYAVDKDNFYPDELSFLPVLYDDNLYDNTSVMKYVAEYAKNNNNQRAAAGMVCLGYGHTIIKPVRYEKEQEWRLVIPIRDDGAHSNYFNIDHEKKRDMSTVISAVYLGPRFNELNDFEKYKSAIIDRWEIKGIPVYQIVVEDGDCVKAVQIESE